MKAIERLTRLKEVVPMRRKSETPDLSSATTVFDKSMAAREKTYLDNHLNTAKTDIKIFESSPKLR